MTVPIENFGMLISLKTDYIYKLLEKDIVIKLLKVDKEQIDMCKNLFFR